MGLFRIMKQTKSNEHSMAKNPNWKEAISWLFTSVAKDLNLGQLRTNSASDQSGTRTRDQWIAILTHRPPSHTASLKLTTVHLTSCKVYSYLKPFSCMVYIDVSRGRISVSTHSSLTLRSMT